MTDNRSSAIKKFFQIRLWKTFQKSLHVGSFKPHNHKFQCNIIFSSKNYSPKSQHKTFLLSSLPQPTPTWGKCDAVRTGNAYKLLSISFNFRSVSTSHRHNLEIFLSDIYTTTTTRSLTYSPCA
mgnify:CR=1 FL=1